MDTKCPYCGEEMVLGYIRSRDGVVWAKDPSGISSIPIEIFEPPLPLRRRELCETHK